MSKTFIQDVQFKNLKRKSLRGGVIAIGNQGIKFCLQTGSTVIMARLLTPADFGLIAMVSSFIGFVTMFQDFGLSVVTIQKQSISGDELSCLFWLNVLLGLIMMIVIFISAPLIASFYSEPKAQDITMAFGGIGILSSFGSQHSALLVRKMRFGDIAACELTAMIVGILFGVGAAFLGMSFWALVILQAANAMAGTILLWWKSGWRPGAPKRISGLIQILKFGGAQTISSLLAYANHNIDNILLGRFLGETAVGFYSKAHGILNTPLLQVLPPIMKVAYPMLSRLFPDQPQFKKASIKLTEIVCFGGCLLLLGIFPTADWIVYLILGDQWAETIPVFRLLAIFGLLEPLSWLLGTIMVASGKPESMAKWWAVTIVFVLISFVAGLPWGVIGVAFGFTLSGIVTRAWLIFFVGNRIGISGFKFIAASAPFVLSASGVIVVMMLIKSVWKPESAAIGLLLFVMMATVMYLSTLYCIPSGRKFIRNLWEMGRDAVMGLKGEDS